MWCRATGLIHHLCDRARAHREYSSLPSWGDKRAATAPRHSPGGKHRDGKHHVSGIKGLGVALCAVSGLVNHRGTQGPAAAPRVGTEGLGLRSRPFSWWLPAQLPAINSPLCPTFNLLRPPPRRPPPPCLLPFPWLNSAVESAQSYSQDLHPAAWNNPWMLCNRTMTQRHSFSLNSCLFFFCASIHSSVSEYWDTSTSSTLTISLLFLSLWNVCILSVMILE